MVKNLPAMWETQVWSLGQEDPLEKVMANHSSISAEEFHGQRSLVGYIFHGSQRVEHDWATNTFTFNWSSVNKKFFKKILLYAKKTVMLNFNSGHIFLGIYIMDIKKINCKLSSFNLLLRLIDDYFIYLFIYFLFLFCFVSYPTSLLFYFLLKYNCCTILHALQVYNAVIHILKVNILKVILHL